MLLLARLAVVEGSDVAMEHGLPGEPGADGTPTPACGHRLHVSQAKMERRASHFDALNWP